MALRGIAGGFGGKWERFMGILTRYEKDFGGLAFGIVIFNSVQYLTP